MNLDEVARKRQLDNILRLIRKHLGTMVILPLAEFEEAFGILWKDIPEGQQGWAEQWAHTRARILNRANGQSRLINELLGQLVTRLDNQ